ncbi:hypothetical protein BX666DRAFT_1878862 [Dichotomocladium elegans]|nr:hypothetical protein BX666DRAFT_1878862 [Dichotomocladium elegans]
MSRDYKVVIAYDFGTTYSGAAYAFTHSSPPEVFDVQKWPNKGGSFFPKVPTTLVYRRSDESLVDWGYGAKKVMIKPYAAKQNVLVGQFKLLLDEDLGRTIHTPAKPAIHIIADYLRVLHQHTLQEITRGFAKNYHPDTFRYCLTVPALWSDRAKHAMRQAAVLAGLVAPSDPSDRLVLISEPEAAALYCEQTMDMELKEGDRIMVCDAGGGTVDLIVFDVSGKHQLKEVTKGLGESCGSVFLDEQYKAWLTRQLGQDIMDAIPPREVADLMDQFIDIIKPEFDGIDDQYVTLPRSVPLDRLDPRLNEDNALDEGTIKLSASVLKEEIFDPVVNKVLSLIRQQYEQIPDGRLTYLLLVGGFGSSNYLYQRIQDTFFEFDKIVCPAERAALAVVRGAAYYGLNPQVIKARVSRRTYGINAGLPFEDHRDPPSTRVVRPDGSVRCTTRFLVFVKKGDVLPIDQCIREHMYVYYGTVKYTDIMLYATEKDDVPRYYNDPDVKHVAAISVPIPDMPGVMHGERISYTVRMYFGTTEIRMEADFGTGQSYRVYCDFDAVDRYDDLE